MGKRKKEPVLLGPAAFVQFSMPFWEALLETDTPDFVFQPVKALALGQIQAASLVNRRSLACLELPQKLAACRSPEDFLQVQQSFLQGAMQDYADTVQAMTGAMDRAVAKPAADADQLTVRHDYLPLPDEGPEGDAMEDQDSAQKTPNAAKVDATPTPARKQITTPGLNGTGAVARPQNRS